MQIEIIRAEDEFFSMRNEWNALLEASASDCVFLTHEWLWLWWKRLAEGRCLSIITARENGELVGVLPIAEREPQYVRMMPRLFEFLGSGMIGSDYLDAILKKGYEAEVAGAFAERLHALGRMLQLSQLRSGSCQAAMLADRMRSRGWIVIETKLNICPKIDLTGLSWETYLATRGPSLRKNVNRYFRHLAKGFNTRLENVQSASQADAALSILIDLHRKRWEQAGNSEAFQSDAAIAFHREFVHAAAERGWLRLLILWLDDRPAAALYGLRYGPAFNFYQSGFDPFYSKQSVGVVMMGLAIKSAIEEGALEYDFLHGDEQYKFHWAGDTRDLARLELYPAHRPAQIYRRAITFNRAARRLVRSFAWT